MSKISDKTKILLKNDIMSILHEASLRSMYTFHIAQELRRDNEFTLKLLLELKKQKLVEEIKKGKHGEYLARRKWRIPPKVRERIDIV